MVRNFLREIKEKVLVYDGSKGTMLQRMGLSGGESPELWNITHSKEVRKVYSLYKEAGADVIQTNTFQGNRISLEAHGLGDKVYELNYEGARLAREVMESDGFVAASIGPTGKLFEPSGDLTFKEAYDVFKEQIKAVVDGGVDIINFETFTDIAEMRAALLAAKETTDLPVICSVAFESNGRTLMGTDPYTAVVVLKSLGADMVGANCSFGPEHMLDVIKSMAEAGGIYFSVKPNAGLPKIIDGRTYFEESPQKFAQLAPEFVALGARLIGGCCGTTPEFISAIRQGISGCMIPKTLGKSECVITSNVKTLKLDEESKLGIGRICAKEDIELQKKLSEGDIEYITDISLDLADEGYDAIYINMNGAAEGSIKLPQVVNEAQSYIREPFIIETDNSAILDEALRLYKGKAGVVVEGYDSETMEALITVARKYGSTIVKRKYLE